MFNAAFNIANAVEEYIMIRIGFHERYNTPKVRAIKNLPCVDTDHIVGMYLNGYVCCKCMVGRRR